MTEPTKILHRLPQQGQIAGVCAGLAEYINMDVTLVRVIFIVLAVITGGGFILVYILLAIVMPSTDIESKSTDIGQNVKTLADDMRSNAQQNKLRNYIGLGLIVLGTWLFIGQLFPGWIDRTWDYAWPVALILLGIFIATRRS